MHHNCSQIISFRSIRVRNYAGSVRPCCQVVFRGTVLANNSQFDDDTYDLKAKIICEVDRDPSGGAGYVL